MKYKVDQDKLFITLKRGEEIIPELQKIAKLENIKSAAVMGIGAVENPVLGYFDYPTKKYHQKSFEGEFEILSFNGNITVKDDVHFLHSHVTISGTDFHVFGGHLFNGKISAAGEFFMIKSSIKITRKLDNTTGLALWYLND